MILISFFLPRVFYVRTALPPLVNECEATVCAVRWQEFGLGSRGEGVGRGSHNTRTFCEWTTLDSLVRLIGGARAA